MALFSTILVRFLLLDFFENLKIYFLIIALFQEVERIVRGTQMAVYLLSEVDRIEIIQETLSFLKTPILFYILFHLILFLPWSPSLIPPALPSTPF